MTGLLDEGKASFLFYAAQEMFPAVVECQDPGVLRSLPVEFCGLFPVKAGDEMDQETADSAFGVPFAGCFFHEVLP